MCTITLEYNQNSALARRKLAMLLATGLFLTKEIIPDDQKSEERGEENHREEIEGFFEASKKSMSNVVARYL